MAVLTIAFSLQVEDGDIQTERIQPENYQITVAGEHLRRAVALPAGETITLDAGEMEPKLWFLQNVHATTSAVVSFGATDDIVLEPGVFAFFPSSMIPVARAVTGSGKLHYGVFT